MIKKLTKHGNSMAIVIDKGMLDLLNIDDKTLLDISTDGKILFVRDEKKRQQFEEALEKVNKKYGRGLKKLAT